VVVSRDRLYIWGFASVRQELLSHSVLARNFKNLNYFFDL